MVDWMRTRVDTDGDILTAAEAKGHKIACNGNGTFTLTKLGGCGTVQQYTISNMRELREAMKGV